MGVKFSVFEVKNEIIYMSSNLKKTKLYITILIDRLNKYVESDSLKSETYDNHKSYVRNIHLPILRGISLLCDVMMDNNNTYIDAIEKYFDNINFVDEDLWRYEYEKILEEYNEVNQETNDIVKLFNTSPNYVCSQNYGSSVPKNSMAQARQIIKTNGINTNNNFYAILINKNKRTAETLYEQLQELHEKIEKTINFINETTYIYNQAFELKNAIDKAVCLIDNIAIVHDNVYLINVIDYIPLNNLDSLVNRNTLALIIKNELGDNLKTYDDLMNLSDDERIEYSNEIYDIVRKYIPDIAVSTTIGRIEVPICNGVTVYYYIDVNGEIVEDDGEQIIELEAVFEENNFDLAGFNLNFNDIEAEIENDGIIKYIVKKDIDDDTEGYNMLECDIFNLEYSIESGVSTSISSVSIDGVRDTIFVDTAVGINISIRPYCEYENSEEEYGLVPIPELIDQPETIIDYGEGNDSIFFVNPSPSPMPMPEPFPVPLPIL